MTVTTAAVVKNDNSQQTKDNILTNKQGDQTSYTRDKGFWKLL
jgi:hypothetical protein